MTMTKLKLAMLLGLTVAVVGLVYVGPDYLPLPRFVAYETALAVFEPDTETMSPRVQQALEHWGFVKVNGQSSLRSNPGFYSCIGPNPTDDAALFGIYRCDGIPQPVFAEVRIAEVESGHSFVSIAFHTLPGTGRYTNRHHGRAATRRLASYREAADRWFRTEGAAPREVAWSLQYAADHRPGTCYTVARGDYVKSMKQPLPEWLVAEPTLADMVIE